MKPLRTFLIAVILLHGFHVAIASADILYVDDDAPAGGNGTSWSSAYKFLQDALTNARNSGGAVTEIRIAEGTYQPDRSASSPNGTRNRWSSFSLINGVSLTGGYSGINGESPNPSVHTTILSGDLAGDDLDSNPATLGENCYHVMDAEAIGASTIVQGFTITSGNANGIYDDFGGGFANYGRCDATFKNCTFFKNQASKNGGAVYNIASNPRFENCSFDQNKAGGNGGGAYVDQYSGGSFIGCTFEGNSAYQGGALYGGNSSPTVDRCIFNGNSAQATGGAIHLMNTGTSAVSNDLFVENQAALASALYIQGPSRNPIINCTFVNNTASFSAASGGSAILVYQSTASPTIDNSILWGNAPAQLATSGGGVVTVSNSDVQGGWAGTANLNSNPQFVDSGANNYQLLSTSPLINMGNTSFFPNATTATDLAANPRLVGSAIDMGAYEFQGAQAPVISSSSPTNNFVDPLEDRDASSGTLLGLHNISLTFSGAVTSASGSALGASNFQVRCVRNGAAAADLQTGLVPAVTQVSGSGAGPYILQLSQRLCLGAWTEVKAINVVSAANGTPLSTSGYDNRIVLGNLPMDITQDGKVLGDDISRWLAINTNAFDPAPLTKLLLLDQKRDGLLNGPDINRAIQLLNGIGSFRIWNQFDMGVRP